MRFRRALAARSLAFCDGVGEVVLRNLNRVGNLFLGGRGTWRPFLMLGVCRHPKAMLL